MTAMPDCIRDVHAVDATAGGTGLPCIDRHPLPQGGA